MKDAAGKTSGDCLIFELDSKLYGLGAQAVESIAEVDKTSFLPGGRGFVHGVIGIRGTPVAVIDAGAALAGPPRPEAAGGGKGEVIGRKRIVVLKDGDRVMGLDIGEADVFFLREREGNNREGRGKDGRVHRLGSPLRGDRKTLVSGGAEWPEGFS
ncbi:MAG: chemotaxis protein CheW [Deltaproteobacteria bacterium]|nr:chemotaxis protein CheW [Deltaproteobacteria bacterium]